MLTLDQLWTLYPEVMVLNVDEELLVVCNTDTIPVDSVTGLSRPPSHLLRLDCTYSLPFVQPLNGKVNF